MTWLRCSGWGLSSALQEGPALLNILRSWMGWAACKSCREEAPKQASREVEMGNYNDNELLETNACIGFNTV